MQRQNPDMNPTIPLVRADLTTADQRALFQQLQLAPFDDAELLERWEFCFQTLWERPAVAFSDAVELIAALKTVFNWPSGSFISSSPLLAPAWREAFSAAWLHLIFQDIDAHTGVNRQSTGTQTLTAQLHVHPFGLPAPDINSTRIILEEISSLIKPLAGSGNGTLQLLHLDGNRIIQAGGSCLALSRDSGLIQELKKIRLLPPSAAACALGVSQLAHLDLFLERRQRLAKRYLALHDRHLFTYPSPPGAVRVWEIFFIHLADRHTQQELAAFLNKSSIGAASPIWFKPPPEPGLPGLKKFMDTALALPLYAALGDGEQKRIINRLHRWLERNAKK